MVDVSFALDLHIFLSTWNSLLCLAN